MSTTVFLPGASGEREFWAPVAERLGLAEAVRLNWPGAGDEPHDPAIAGYDDLVERAADALAPHGDLIAQSLGGVVALRVAARHPDRVRRLVLSATPGPPDQSTPVFRWVAEYHAEYPNAAAWITQIDGDPLAPAGDVAAPTLLLWSDADPISPLAVGRELEQRIADAQLHIVAGAGHRFAHDDPGSVAGAIAGHLRR